MNKSGYIKTGLILIAGIFLLNKTVYTQEYKLTKEERKVERSAGRLRDFQVLDSLLDRKSFVLKADYLENKYGDRVVVPDNLNFIKVDSTVATLQTGSNTQIGYNGVGGVTAEGRISNWKLVKNFKSMSYFLRFSIISDIGFYDISMNISAGTNARATITGTTSGQLIYTGHIVPSENSNVYKGQVR